MATRIARIKNTGDSTTSPTVATTTSRVRLTSACPVLRAAVVVSRCKAGYDGEGVERTPAPATSPSSIISVSASGIPSTLGVSVATSPTINSATPEIVPGRPPPMMDLPRPVFPDEVARRLAEYKRTKDPAVLWPGLTEPARVAAARELERITRQAL